MNLNHGIQKLFLIPTIVFVTISFLSIKNVYAEGRDVYRPSYSWANVKTSNTATNAMDALSYNAAFYGQIGKDLALSKKGLAELPVFDSLGFWGKNGTVSPFTVMTVSTGDVDTLQNIGNKNVAYFEKLYKDQMERYIKNPSELKYDLTEAHINQMDPMGQFGVHGARKIRIPQEIAHWKAFAGNIETIFDKTQESNIGYKRDYFRELKSIQPFDRNYLKSLNTLDNAFYQEQYQSAQFRIHDPILDFQEPSIDLQSHESVELSQSYADNLRSLETKLMTDAHTSFYAQSGLDSFKAPDFSKYQNVSNQINPQFNNLPSRSTVFRDHLLYNDVGRSFRQQQIYQSPSIVDLGTIRISAPTIHIPRFEPSSSRAFQIPDFSKYQNVSNQINPQFNNLPSRSTVFRDHLLYNDVGRSFRQQQIYQSPSIVDLGTIRISAPTIPIPRFEPTQIPRYEPIYIPQVPIPVYQPPAMPNF